jgi:hypothetical protein
MGIVQDIRLGKKGSSALLRIALEGGSGHWAEINIVTSKGMGCDHWWEAPFKGGHIDFIDPEKTEFDLYAMNAKEIAALPTEELRKDINYAVSLTEESIKDGLELFAETPFVFQSGYTGISDPADEYAADAFLQLCILGKVQYG